MFLLNSCLLQKDGEEVAVPVSITLNQAVTLTFSLKYLQNFAKSAPLADRVSLKMSNEVPLLVGFAFEHGHINYYLAPKLVRLCVDCMGKEHRLTDSFTHTQADE